MFDTVRESLIEEARRSPELLADLAGLERYISESYDARSFIELLQNADDASASRFLVVRESDKIFVANDGKPFNADDFRSLCRSAASAKSRGQTIGYRGIGFKSVVGLAETVYLFSDDLEAVFSRERTKEVIPEAHQVPLIRIPHSLKSEEREEFFDVLSELRDEGYTTIFGFTNLVASGIESEFSAFDASSLLFLRRVRQLELRASTEEIVTVKRKKLDNHWATLRLTDSSNTREWSVYAEGDIALAFGHDDKGVAPLHDNDAVVHAFLPTLESTGLGIKINGDFSTDPSRTRVVFDERTFGCLRHAAKLIAELMRQSLTSENEDLDGAKNILKALTPLDDPRMASLKRRSFSTEILEAIKEAVGRELIHLRLKPSWLNFNDFEKLAKSAELVVVQDVDEALGLRDFLRFLDVREANFEEFKNALKSEKITPVGASELVSQLVKRNTVGQLQDDFALILDWLMWVDEDGQVASLRKITQRDKKLDNGFVDAVVEKTGSPKDLERFLEKLVDGEVVSQLLEATQLPSPPLNKQQSTKESTSGEPDYSLESSADLSREISLTRWRSAEQQVIELFEHRGWSVQDVSRQNLGYDIEAISESGQELCIEVKSLNYLGQPFTLTSNEEVVARMRQTQYLIALVWQEKDRINIGFIENPAKNLNLNRQCRQWVWECSEYETDPETFDLK